MGGTPTASSTPPTITPTHIRHALRNAHYITSTPLYPRPPTISPLPRAPTAIVEGLSDGDESAVSTSFSDDHRSLRDDLRDDLSSPRPRSTESKFIKIDDDNNNSGNGNGDITISKEEYKRYLALRGSPPESKQKDSAPKPVPSAPPEDDILGSMDRMIATLSDLEDDLEPIDGVETESDSDSDEAEARRELLTDKWRQLFDKEVENKDKNSESLTSATAALAVSISGKDFGGWGRDVALRTMMIRAGER
ncbi:uncharacterized protein [Palaemon carinicauda]|uniref:uncharacterized protein n=1 Tax=Palaemon carinicauda TaxID=392227 RepID=UPI0035B64388